MRNDERERANLGERIRAARLFNELGGEAREALARVMEIVGARAGSPIFREGESSAALYLVLEGVLHATEQMADGSEVVIRVIGPGAAVDERQVLSGSSRPVTVSAVTEARLARAPGAVIDRLVGRHPELRVARDRLHRRQLLCRLHHTLGVLDDAFLDDLEEMAEWVQLGKGELLFGQNNPGQGIYLVASGRVQTLRVERDGSTHVLGEAGRGESAGEIAFFRTEPWQERVQAIRDSVLVGFSTDAFEQLISRRPQILRQVTRNLIDRLSRRPVARRGGRITNLAVVPATPGAPMAEFCDRLVAALSAFGPTLRLTASSVDRYMAEPGISQVWGDGPDSASLLAWLEAREGDHRFVIYEAEPGTTPWTRRCMRQADRILLVARANEDPRPGELERSLLALERPVSDAYEMLVVIHADGTRLPTGTRRWLSERRVEEHFHLRWSSGADFARLARCLAGRAVGLVLGGGGARAFAHIGVLRALAEAGIPVDAIGGTSMGAWIAAQHAMGLSAQEVGALSRRVWLEVRPHKVYTVPVLSVLGTRQAEMRGRMMYGDAEIEDLWIPFFCVSSNLTTAEMVVHRSGSLLRAATASASLPGIDLPVMHGNQLLVDGALLNNVPADVMRQLGCGTVVASEVSVDDDAYFRRDRMPTAWEAVRDRIFTRTRTSRFPSFMEVAMRASVLHSIHREKAALREADVSLRPPIDEFGLMDFPRFDEIVAAGYDHARDEIATWRTGTALFERLQGGVTAEYSAHRVSAGAALSGPLSVPGAEAAPRM
ncbi:MAG TPA: cyclic nucleotide-binding and patatin-like phospholipase domain-containing protein [Gemmatimonadaceae bacterium]|nr:cyclic nucleotide-binding and patatin-like phospholipase domain-containing protein [Gemmatimonadaceae bacterium]